MKLRRLLPVLVALAVVSVFTNGAQAGEPFHPIVDLGSFFRWFWF